METEVMRLVLLSPLHIYSSKFKVKTFIPNISIPEMNLNIRKTESGDLP